MRPANYYASNTLIPEYIETAIASLEVEDRLHLAADLIAAIRGNDEVFLASTTEAQWLRSQSFDGLLSVLKWVTSELL